MGDIRGMHPAACRWCHPGMWQRLLDALPPEQVVKLLGWLGGGEQAVGRGFDSWACRSMTRVIDTPGSA